MDTVSCEGHSLALAASLKGEVTSAPRAGVATVMADADAQPATSANRVIYAVFIRYASIPSQSAVGTARFQCEPVGVMRRTVAELSPVG